MSFNSKHIILCTVATTFIYAGQIGVAHARDQIRIVGSSTVYPFISVVAEEFGKASGMKTPIVESTGTGGGIKLFCAGTGEDTPDISNASREIKKSELEQCKKNGVVDPLEVKIGYDGIVIANSTTEPKASFTTQHLFLALAKQVPQDGKLIDNPYQQWNEIDPALPANPIEVYGPPPTSGTRDSFVELVMEKSCKSLPEFVAAYSDEETRKKTCHVLREDGKFIEAGENDNILVQKLTSNPKSFAVFGYSFLEENAATVQGSTVEGIEATYDSIANGSYAISRPLYIYAKREHIGKIAGIREFLQELTSAKAMGESGYLALKGLIAPSEQERAAAAEAVNK